MFGALADQGGEFLGACPWAARPAPIVAGAF
jgi:hypothetical protein